MYLQQMYPILSKSLKELLQGWIKLRVADIEGHSLPMTYELY